MSLRGSRRNPVILLGDVLGSTGYCPVVCYCANRLLCLVHSFQRGIDVVYNLGGFDESIGGDDFPFSTKERRLRTVWRMCSIRYSIRYIEEHRPMRSSLQGAG